MLESCHTTAPVTLTTTADATNLVNLRLQFKAVSAQGRELPGYIDFVVKLTAIALRDHPLLNARWDNDRIVIPMESHIGIAVDTEEGLLVPVIRDVNGLGLGQIVARSRELSQRARERRLRPDEMQAGTFTITNLGSFGVETFTPIINPPECAVLGMGRIVREPVMVGDQMVARERMSLSLTFDHRIVDGAPAARFLQSLVQLIENPGPWLIP
jgi:pyruvate dehydrogenase E2 component (dihydrolipoamide acetyltransferase)